MQLTPEAGTWILPFSLLCSLKVGAREVKCGPEEFLQAGSCRPCPRCPDGQQLSAVCGNGLGAGAECVPCPPDHYSNADTSGHRCLPCANCDWENKVQEVNCTPSQNAVCGQCLEGYFQFADRFCEPCSFEPNDPYCKDWLAQQTTLVLQQTTLGPVGQQTTSSPQQLTVILTVPWKTLSYQTDIEPEHITESYDDRQKQTDWQGIIVGLSVIAVLIVISIVNCCIWRCCWHENSISKEPEKQEMKEQTTASQHGDFNVQVNFGDQSTANVLDNSLGGINTDELTSSPEHEGINITITRGHRRSHSCNDILTSAEATGHVSSQDEDLSADSRRRHSASCGSVPDKASNLEEEFGGTTDGAAAPPDDEGALCSSQDGQAAKGLIKFSNFLADLTKKALEATADMKLENLNQDLRDILSRQLNPEPKAQEFKNWRHFAWHFKIDKKFIDYWKGRDDPMMHVLEYLEKSRHVTVAEIIDAIQSIGMVNVVESFCQSLLNEEYN